MTTPTPDRPSVGAAAEKTLGQVAYEAWAKGVGTVPQWDALNHTKASWEAAAKAVVDAELLLDAIGGAK